jgi:hypothetical protein
MTEKINVADEKFCQAITLLSEVHSIVANEFGYSCDGVKEFNDIINELTDCELAKSCKFGI